MTMMRADSWTTKTTEDGRTKAGVASTISVQVASELGSWSAGQRMSLNQLACNDWLEQETSWFGGRCSKRKSVSSRCSTQPKTMSCRETGHGKHGTFASLQLIVVYSSSLVDLVGCVTRASPCYEKFGLSGRCTQDREWEHKQCIACSHHVRKKSAVGIQ